MTDSTPPPHQPIAEAQCVICLQTVPLVSVTAGSLYADGRQAFACNGHIHERLRWVLAWLAFDAEQQEQHEHNLGSSVA